MVPTFKSPAAHPEVANTISKSITKDLVDKCPWVRNAQQRLFQTLETDYGFPRVTCRLLVNLIWDFLNETFGEKLHEGQIVFQLA